jgi:hypothetical protein
VASRAALDGLILFLKDLVGELLAKDDPNGLIEVAIEKHLGRDR